MAYISNYITNRKTIQMQWQICSHLKQNEAITLFLIFLSSHGLFYSCSEWLEALPTMNPQELAPHFACKHMCQSIDVVLFGVFSFFKKGKESSFWKRKGPLAPTISFALQIRAEQIPPPQSIPLLLILLALAYSPQPLNTGFTNCISVLTFCKTTLRFFLQPSST